MPTVTKDVRIVLSGAEPVVSWEVYRDEIHSDEEKQTKESLNNLKNGEYIDYEIDEYVYIPNHLPDLRSVDSLFFS